MTIYNDSMAVGIFKSLYACCNIMILHLLQDRHSRSGCLGIGLTSFVVVVVVVVVVAAAAVVVVVVVVVAAILCGHKLKSLPGTEWH